MKKAGRSLATILLLFALTTTAFAGQMDAPPAPIPGHGQMDAPPAPTTGRGQIDAAPAFIADETSTIDTLAEFALDIWKFLPSLF
ncbi:MAG: hypothetical protein H7Z38_20810 [Rubrivivax sp.]|nr:hypothetical protein [Pyrinomonadaceae bacterium]